MLKKIIFAVLLIYSLSLICLLFSGLISLRIWQNLKNKNLRITQQISAAQLLTKPASWLSFHLIPDLETYNLSLQLLAQLQPLSVDVSLYSQHLFEPVAQTHSRNFQEKIQKLMAIEQLWKKNYSKSILFPRLLKNEDLNRYDQALTDLQKVSQQVLTGEHRYLLILQNSQELRATGGFMGTYALISLNDGQITDFKIQDIYEPDGQFTGYVVAPPGVAEYLSSGKGLRLPDANWHPDFPTSARQILDFFALGEKVQLEAVIAINLSLGENLLNITGPVWLPDYQLTVDSKNLAEVARADRANFFPGSQQKPNFFNNLLTQLKLKINNLTLNQQQDIAKLFFKSMTTKDMQFFATDQELQTLANRYNLSGELIQNATAPNFYLVESNVGINKSNRLITREVNWEISDYRTMIAVAFHNQNTDTDIKTSNHNDYINYQRLIMPPDYQIFSINFNGEKILKFDENLIKNSRGEEFKQIGFLITIPHQHDDHLAIELINPTNNFSGLTSPNIFIHKQPGLPATPYTLKYLDKIKNILLEQDTLVSW